MHFVGLFQMDVDYKVTVERNALAQHDMNHGIP
jgi:hypothetical protein